MTSHATRRTVTEAGFVAACSCGWRTTRHTRELRDRQADSHELQPLNPDDEAA